MVNDSYQKTLATAMFVQNLPKFHLVEEYSGMLMTGTEMDCHNSYASRDGIAGELKPLLLATMIMILSLNRDPAHDQ